MLLVQATEDTRVTMQHSMILAKVRVVRCHPPQSLADRGTLFHQQVYTGEGNSLAGVSPPTSTALLVPGAPVMP